jgi:sialate O-acetylesterase
MAYYGKKTTLNIAIIIALFLLGNQSVFANIAVSNLFSSHMVLQRGMVVPVWGTASSGEQVTVGFNGQSKSVQTGTNGKWRIQFDAMVAGGPFTMTVSGNNTLTVTDVYVGDVWQCAGQSNMDTRLSYYPNLADSIANANVPLLRYNTLRQPGQTTAGSNSWLVVSPSTAGKLSAAGYFFGKEIQKTTGVAVGLVVSAVGGTFVEQWLDPVTLAANPAIVDTFKGQMWNAWVAYAVGYGIKGTIWIQGEQNSTSAMSPTYSARFKLLINGWRTAWGQGNFPFYYGQLSNTHALQTDPNNISNVAVVREGQRLGLSLPNTAMSVNIGLGEDSTWHFHNKPEAGRRLALLAKAQTYGQTTLVYSGPMYQSMTISGNQVKLLFNTFGSTMVAQGGTALTGFAIAGATGNWIFGNAIIKGDTIIVSSTSVAAPTKVRYAWADNPVFNLYNAAGLPASPFSTESPAVVSILDRGFVYVKHSIGGTILTNGICVNSLGRQTILQKTTGAQIIWNNLNSKGTVILKNSEYVQRKNSMANSR